jgi:hypothetical protein
MSDAAPFSPQVPVDAQQPAVPDIATQPVVPSESAGTQTAAGAPSEQDSAPEGAQTDTGGDTPSPAITPEANAGAPPVGTTDGTQSVPPVEPHAPADAPKSDEPEEEAEREQGPPPAPVERATRVAPNGDVFDGDVEHPATNTFCKVVAGPHQGRYGVFQSTANIGADGWPDQVVVRTRDAEDENIVVAYSDIRPDVAGRR